MDIKISTIDLVIFLTYIVGTVLFGASFVLRSRSTDAFTTARRSMPGWLCGMSIFATYVSSISFLALPGKAYGTNWNAYAFTLSLPLAIWVAIRFFVPLYRERGDVSAYSYLEWRFGPWARLYVSICYLLTQLARMGIVMYLTALPVGILLGWDIKWVIVLTGVSVTIYTLMGGIEAVIWNDTIQGILLITGAVVCAVILPFAMPEGPGQLFRIAVENHKFSFGSFGSSLAESTFWVVLIYGVFINLNNFGIDQNFIQRFIAAKSDREAKKSVWFGGLLYIPVSAVFFFIGTGLFAYYTAQPDLLPEALRPEGKADQVFPYFIVSALPVGATGLLIAALFAAAMSTVSTSLNSSATLILTDYYKRFFRKDATEKQSMVVLYSTSLILGIASTLIALAMIGQESALDIWWIVSGIFSGGMIGLFLLGYFARRAKNFEAVIGVTLGVLLILWMAVSVKFPGAWGVFTSPFHGFLPIVFGTTTIFLVGFLLASILRSKPAARNQE